jgi:hypothetical protein
MKPSAFEIHQRQAAVVDDLMDYAADEPLWTQLMELCASLDDVDLPMTLRFKRLDAAVALVRGSSESNLPYVFEHHLLLRLDRQSDCPRVQDRLARLLLHRDGIAIEPLKFGGRVLTREIGVLRPPEAVKAAESANLKVDRDFMELGSMERWIGGLKCAEQLVLNDNVPMDMHQAAAGLNCLSMAILNLHCMADQRRAARLRLHLWQFGPQLWKTLRRRLDQGLKEHPSERMLRLHPFTDEVYKVLSFRLRSEVAHLNAEAPACRASGPAVAAPLASSPDSIDHHWVRAVKEPIPPSSDRVDREVIAQFQALREPMPVRMLDGVDDLRRRLDQLRAEFPWAEQVVETIRGCLEPRLLLGSREFKLPHLLLAGLPGSGKSRLARRIAAIFELPYVPIPVGGVADAKALLGTARGWATGAPSPLLASMLTHRTVSGLALLDELDKAGTSRHNGQITSALLSMLEPETASNYRDGFLQAACDLSWLTFIGTVNSLRLPKALLSRFRIVYVPEPGAEHRPALAGAVAAELAARWGVPPELFPPIPADVVQRAGTSARDLQRCVEDYLADWARETFRAKALH